MATLIALQTIHGALTEPLFDKAGEPLRDARGRHRHRQIEAVLIAPNEPFDPSKLGIGTEEALSLIKSGAAREQGSIEAGMARSAAAELAKHPPAGGAGSLPSEDDMEKMSRADLDALASARGLDPAAAKNKGELIDMLLEDATA